MTALHDDFANPGSPWRGKPFWAWNGRLEADELCRQLGIFKEMGLGGAFMHSRVGLATPYLSTEWFDLVRTCCTAAAHLGIEAWLYDEDRWPSGAAGGLVTREPRYRQRYLDCTVHAAAGFAPHGQEIGIFVARVDGVDARDVRPWTGTCAAGESVLAFTEKLADPSSWYNGQTYLDTLNVEAVRRFVEVTHEAYGDEVLGHYDNAVVPGIFTDEPNYGHMLNREVDGRMCRRAPWTDVLPAVFHERYGYDLLEHLPVVFFRLDGEAFNKTRRDYFDCLAFLFSTAFSRQIGEWCAANHIVSTGHMLAEETLASQTATVGAAMRHYEYMQAPGIDILRGEMLERAGGTRPELLTAKQCESVRRQFGRDWLLSELYGCTGWHFTFAEHKAVGDWQAALGVNLRCQHLAWYTMLGQAKRDYPASISFQSAWWRDYRLVEDYFARVNRVCSQGEVLRDVAVVHPVESAWAVTGDTTAVAAVQQQLDTIQDALLEHHFDFDYLDEDLLERHGRVEDGRLWLNLAGYRAVVVPPLLTMRRRTLDLLTEFQAVGGQVIFVEPVPPRVECHVDAGPANVAATRVPLDAAALAAALAANHALARVSIATADGREYPHALYMLRRDDDGRTLLFLCHRRQTVASGPLTVHMPGAGQLQEWDPGTGAITVHPTLDSCCGTRLTTELPPVGSRIFVVDPVAADLPVPAPAVERRRQPLDPPAWDIALAEPNALVLDRPEWRLDGGAWQPADDILHVDYAVRDALGLPRRGGQMVQPWAQEALPDSRTGRLELRYRFVAETETAGANLVLELPERFAIVLDGNAVAPTGHGWWIDPAMRRLALPTLTAGKHTLDLTIDYTADYAGLEAVFLTGAFGMRWEARIGVLSAPPATLTLGDWGDQGLPCYSAGVTYRTTVTCAPAPGERAVLEIPGWEGVLLKVRFAGRELGRLAWPPCEVELPAGEGLLEIEVVSSRRNLLGPLHLTDVYPFWTGAGQFVRDAANGGNPDLWTDDYVRLPYGLTAPPVVSYRGPTE